MAWRFCCSLPVAARPAPVPPATVKAPPPDQFNRIVERYWDERLPPENAISPQYLADVLSVERRYLAEVQALPRERMDASARLNYEIFTRQRESIIEGCTFPAELLPIDPFEGATLQLAAIAADTAQHPLGHSGASGTMATPPR